MKYVYIILVISTVFRLLPMQTYCQNVERGRMSLLSLADTHVSLVEIYTVIRYRSATFRDTTTPAEKLRSSKVQLDKVRLKAPPLAAGSSSNNRGETCFRTFVSRVRFVHSLPFAAWRIWLSPSLSCLAEYWSSISNSRTSSPFALSVSLSFFFIRFSFYISQYYVSIILLILRLFEIFDGDNSIDS